MVVLNTTDVPNSYFCCLCCQKKIVIIDHCINVSGHGRQVIGGIKAAEKCFYFS